MNTNKQNDKKNDLPRDETPVKELIFNGVPTANAEKPVGKKFLVSYKLSGDHELKKGDKISVRYNKTLTTGIVNKFLNDGAEVLLYNANTKDI